MELRKGTIVIEVNEGIVQSVSCVGFQVDYVVIDIDDEAHDPVHITSGSTQRSLSRSLSRYLTTILDEREKKGG